MISQICHGPSYRAVHPPSMRIVSPVIRLAALEARNTTAPATSSFTKSRDDRRAEDNDARGPKRESNKSSHASTLADYG